MYGNPKTDCDALCHIFINLFTIIFHLISTMELKESNIGSPGSFPELLGKDKSYFPNFFIIPFVCSALCFISLEFFLILEEFPTLIPELENV